MLELEISAIDFIVLPCSAQSKNLGIFASHRILMLPPTFVPVLQAFQNKAWFYRFFTGCRAPFSLRSPHYHFVVVPVLHRTGGFRLLGRLAGCLRINVQNVLPLTD